jgi:predicted ATPase/class 3 adenylate cyclase/DNA-binding CsgD family transcriptional regulator
MPELPTGTVTFLFTDIEGSSAHWEQQAVAMRAALARHDTLLRRAIESHRGVVFKTWGDAFCVAFATAPDALAAALEAQRALHAEAAGGGDDADSPAARSPLPAPLRVRMAIHTGTAEERDGDYFGPSLNRVARLLSTGRGGQILLSDTARGLVRDTLPVGTTLRDLGEHRLKDLMAPEHIFQLVTPGLPADFPPLMSLGRRSHNLPVQRQALIGREREVDTIAALLRRTDVGLLTLTGPGGSGKTRLGLQVAAEVVDDFTAGVFVVTLAAISDPSLVAPTIAQTLGVRESEGQPLAERLKDFLREKDLLLVLDNFEQVMPAAPLVADLLAACRWLTVLVTSRTALHLRGEQEWPVPPLDLPPAAALFTERAQEARPDFALTDENAPVLAEICRRLDGLPLALELAAARVKVLSLPHMLARLERRLALLTGGARDLPARQQSLRDTIAWSYDLLSVGEQTLFRRLAVFAGGWTLEAAEALCAGDGDGGAVLNGLASLVDANLVLHAADRTGASRFTMLETIREYAVDRLEASSDASVLREGHARLFLALAEEAAPHYAGRDRRTWLDRLEIEHDNLRAALAWFTEQTEDEAALRLGGALGWFWCQRGDHTEGRHRLKHALARTLSTDRTPVRAQALRWAGQIALLQGDYEAARAQLVESAAIFGEQGDRRGRAFALWYVGSVDYFTGDIVHARAMVEQSLALFRDLGDTWGTASILNLLGLIAAVPQGYTENLRPLFEESLALFRAAGDEDSTAEPLTSLGRVALRSGDLAGARTLLETALALRRERGDPFMIAHSLTVLGDVARREGKLAEANERLIEGLTLFRQVGSRLGVTLCLTAFAIAATAARQPARAARLFGAAEALRGMIGGAIVLTDPDEYDRSVRSVRTQLGDDAIARLWASGRSLPLEQAIAEALTPPNAHAGEREAASPASPAGHNTVLPDGLTDRQADYLRLLADGRTNMEIAEALVVSENAVEQMLVRLYDKIQARNRADAIRYAIAHGLTPSQRP